MRGRPAAVALLVLAVVGCSGDGDKPAPASDGRVRAVLGGVRLVLEVADEPKERATGLMGRTSVPPGTGMLFRFDGLVQAEFYMYRVPVPLRAVFVREGRVVSTVFMPPCPLEDPAACPTYGADGPFDTVVETAPETLADISPGDALVLEPEGS